MSGIAIVSGFHSPIEKDCLPILVRGPDPIIIVQGHRLSTSRLPREWQKAINAGRLLLLSPFSKKDKRVTAELAAAGRQAGGPGCELQSSRRPHRLNVNEHRTVEEDHG